MITTDGEDVEIGGKHHFTKEFSFKESLISTLLYLNSLLFMILIIILFIFEFDILSFVNYNNGEINEVKYILIQVILNYLLIYIIKKINF